MTSQPETALGGTETSRRTDRIDVHTHFLPDFYMEALNSAGLSRLDGIAGLPKWSPEAALKLMDQLGVGIAIVSISSPGVHFGDDAAARALARRVNEEGARLQKSHGGRFGQFASLPLPDVEGALVEVAHALDTLGADGIILLTNHRGMYLGDPKLEPLYGELNNRGAVILIHPTAPSGSISERLAAKYPLPILEYMFETTRAVTDLVVAGVMQRYPKIRFIVPHAGAALSVLINRVDLGLPLLTPPGGSPPPSMREAMKSLHFDLAGVPVPGLLRELLTVSDPQKIHYGSDYPFTPGPVCDKLEQAIEKTVLLDGSLRDDVWRNSALRLFPHLAQGGQLA
jgi:predicted TIM-barrel fold metal-dependent hydrolase